MKSIAKPPKRLQWGLLATLTAVVALFAAAPASAQIDLSVLDGTTINEDGTPVTQAGSHPFAVTSTFEVESTQIDFITYDLSGAAKNLIIDQPAGFIGNTTAVPRCATVDFAAGFSGSASLFENNLTDCPISTVVGATAVSVLAPIAYITLPVYNLEPPPGVPARLGFVVEGVPVTIDVKARNSGDYNVVASLTNISQAVKFFASVTHLWGDPSDPAHDEVRGKCVVNQLIPVFSIGELEFGAGPNADPGGCPTEALDVPFLTQPRACEGPLPTTVELNSWWEPDYWVKRTIVSHDDAEPPNPIGTTGCSKLNFSPEFEAIPTVDSAEAGTGLDVNVSLDTAGLLNPDGIAGSDVKKAEVTLPEGVTINPSIGEGLGVCTPDDLEDETLSAGPGEGCPNSSKIGTLDLETPIVDEGIEGSVYLAEQDDPSTSTPGAENPFDSLIALYLVLKNPELSVNVKLPMKVEPDEETGQLVATLEDLPQTPFSEFNFHFREGHRAPLVAPSTCGTYTTEAKFWPWADPDNPRTVTSSFQITEGPNGGPCPSGGIPPFNPHFEAGSVNNAAGAFSPFLMRLLRADGEQDMTKFSSVLPPGVLGSLAGVGKCPDANVEAAKAKTGREELAAPSCPPNSAIGRTLAGAGVGSALTYVGGGIYLGGPYKGAPLSVISITPAVAGPFDAGTVVVRLGLDLNPVTAEVEVDGAASDPIPHILKGIVLKLRDLRVYVDRPAFTLNPTSCDESSARATLFGSFLDVFDPADDVPVALATRYQAANCLNLGYGPKLNVNLKGGTKRGAFPAFRANYKPRPGDANIEGLVLRLPRSAFLEQGHIRTICTRVQFAAEACPKAAQYGYVRAWTPLLDEPLQGPVWLRSSNNKLPDVVFDLKGLVDIEVATRIDSVRGGIRATLTNLPDAPISRVVLRMQGGKKGLIVNSRQLCSAKSRANVRFSGQNGKRLTRNTVVRPLGCKRKRAKRAALGGLSAVG